MKASKVTDPPGELYFEGSGVYGPKGEMTPNFQLLPPEIRALHPSVVFVRRDQVLIGFGGGFVHWGLIARPENTDWEHGPATRAEKLIDGLWLYEE